MIDPTGRQRLKIAVLVKRFTPTGGSEKYALEVIRLLVERGHNIHLYTREADRRYTAGLSFYQVPDKFSFSSVLSLYSFAVETSRLLQGTTYDVTHSHERGHMMQDVSTLHSFSYRGSGFKRLPLVKQILQVYLSPRSWLHLWLEQKQMQSPLLVPVSETIKQDVLQYYRSKNTISVITPGVDINFFHPAWVSQNRNLHRKKEKIAENEMTVLFVGSEFKRKGLDVLIPAIRPGMRLLVVGRGERMDHYQALARCQGGKRQIVFKGLVDDVRKYYAMADVVVLPSLSEAFGMSVLEGMACGLPVVVSSNAGVAALIEHEKNGFILDTPGQLAGLLQSLQNSYDLQAIGDAARKTAENHTWEATVDQYEALYHGIVSKKKERA